MSEPSEERSEKSAKQPSEPPKEAVPAKPSGAKATGKRVEPPETSWQRTSANVKTIGGAVLLAFFIRIVLFEPFEIEGPSMEPTLLNRDRVVVAKFRYGLFLPFMDSAVLSWGVPSLGDIVILKSWEGERVDIVKRVVGLPGDRMELREDMVWRNGRPITHRPAGTCDEMLRSRDPDEDSGCEWIEESSGDQTYRTSHDPASAPFTSASVTVVPPDHIYVLGDHRDRSNDSRYFGPVPINRVKGKGLIIYWSSDESGSFRSSRFFKTLH